MELEMPLRHGADADAAALRDSFESLANMPAARPTAPVHAFFEAAAAGAGAAGGAGAGSAAFLGAAHDAARAAANGDKTTALVLTCSVMLSIALVLRLCAMHMQRSKHKARRVCCGVVHFKTVLHALDVSVYVVLWYAISIGMTLFNKWFLRVWADGGYPFATTMTCLNMFIKCALSRVVNACSSSASIALTSRTYWRLAVPIGLCTALDIMLSNLSFFYITVTFYTIVKSGGNVWCVSPLSVVAELLLVELMHVLGRASCGNTYTNMYTNMYTRRNLIFSVCLGHQRPSYALAVVIVLISSGLMLASYGSTQFVVHGFVLVLAASVIGTLRWVLTQSLLKAMDDSTHRILAVVYYISPASALGLLPIAIVTEGPALVASKFLRDPHLLVASMGFIFVSGCLAFVLIFVEILLVKKTSALSLGIAGSLKDVTQVVLAVLIFDDRLSSLNVFGLVVATSGMLLYTFLKHSTLEQHQTDDSSSSSLEMAPKYSRVPTTASEPEDEDTDDTVRSETFHEIQVINLDDDARRVRLASASSKREDALVRRESKDYYNSSSNNV